MPRPAPYGGELGRPSGGPPLINLSALQADADSPQRVRITLEGLEGVELNGWTGAVIESAAAAGVTKIELRYPPVPF